MLYPTVSATILDTFYCRKVSAGGMRVLMADYTVTCVDEGGGVNATYVVYIVFGTLLCLGWSV